MHAYQYPDFQMVQWSRGEIEFCTLLRILTQQKACWRSEGEHGKVAVRLHARTCDRVLSVFP
jgi:hypothetical protein